MDGWTDEWMSYFLLLLDFMIKALRGMKENVEGADGMVWRTGRSWCKPPSLQKCLNIEGRGVLALLIWVLQLTGVGSVPGTFNTIHI